jgi:hypothetical protein
MRMSQDKGKDHFNCTDSERAVFEAGIKLGAIYHQFVGATVTPENVDHLERTIEDGTKYQPFVKEIEAKINRAFLRGKEDPYDYQTITGKMLRVRIVTSYGNVEAECEMKWLEDMKYPLMYVKEVRKTG